MGKSVPKHPGHVKVWIEYGFTHSDAEDPAIPASAQRSGMPDVGE
jgi:hypothetical protein